MNIDLGPGVLHLGTDTALIGEDFDHVTIVGPPHGRLLLVSCHFTQCDLRLLDRCHDITAVGCHFTECVVPVQWLNPQLALEHGHKFAGATIDHPETLPDHDPATQLAQRIDDVLRHFGADVTCPDIVTAIGTPYVLDALPAYLASIHAQGTWVPR